MAVFRKKLHRKPGHVPHPLRWLGTTIGTALGAAEEAALMPAPGRRFDRGLAASAYLLLVLLMWAPNNVTGGMPYETEFIYTSDTDGLWKGLFYWIDDMRIHMNFFFHVSYVIGHMLGITGSFIPYNCMYALLWWMRGVLIYLLLERFLPAYPAFRFLAGALVLVHAADSSLLWIGQMNQQGFLLWLILALYCLVAAFQQTAPIPRAQWMLGAAFFQHMTLWTYESPIAIVAAAPLLLLGFRPTVRRLLRFSLAWMIIPGLYVFLTALRYLTARNTEYQGSILRKDWALSSLLHDFAFNLRTSYRFWYWSGERLDYQLWLAVAAVLVVLSAWGWLAWRQAQRGAAVLPSRASLLALGCYGFCFSALSFPAYLLLAQATSGWRTQLLSGPGTMVALAALIGLLAGLWRRWGVAAAGLLTVPVLVCGVQGALHYGARHRQQWEQHRSAVAQIIRLAPALRPYTIAVLLNVPRGLGDPFGESLWFDRVIQLYNPGVPVAGAYFLDNGAPGPGEEWALRNGAWKWVRRTKKMIQNQRVYELSVENTLLLSYDGAGHIQLEPRWTALPVDTAVEKNPGYNPARRIAAATPSPIAARRYRLIE